MTLLARIMHANSVANDEREVFIALAPRCNIRGKGNHVGESKPIYLEVISVDIYIYKGARVRTHCIRK